MKKDYGKLTAEQFQEFIEILPDVFAKLREADDLLALTPKAKFDKVFPGDWGDYSHLYELPFIEHLSWVVFALNRQVEVKDVASSPDPQEAVLAMLRLRDAVEDKPQHEAFTDEEVLSLIYSLNRTILSMVTRASSATFTPRPQAATSWTRAHGVRQIRPWACSAAWTICASKWRRPSACHRLKIQRATCF